jgi:hypothetical protein
MGLSLWLRDNLPVSSGEQLSEQSRLRQDQASTQVSHIQFATFM